MSNYTAISCNIQLHSVSLCRGKRKISVVYYRAGSIPADYPTEQVKWSLFIATHVKYTGISITLCLLYIC